MLCWCVAVTTFGKMIGKRVIGSNTYMLGEVASADIDTGKWQVTHLHVSLADDAIRELGYKKLFTGSVIVCLPVSLIQAVGDVITLNKGIDELKNVVEPKTHKS
jgi:sporulation protein YlmC with PRC-barrel domain